MTERSETPMPRGEIEFHGRTMEVQLPDPGQMLVWKRTLTKLQAANTSDWTGAQVLSALERLRLIVDSTLVNEMDKDWIDDELLAKRLKFQDVAQIPTLVAEAVNKPNNREERRAAKKTAPARRVPAKKATGARNK